MSSLLISFHPFLPSPTLSFRSSISFLHVLPTTEISPLLSLLFNLLPPGGPSPFRVRLMNLKYIHSSVVLILWNRNLIFNHSSRMFIVQFFSFSFFFFFIFQASSRISSSFSSPSSKLNLHIEFNPEFGSLFFFSLLLEIHLRCFYLHLRFHLPPFLFPSPLPS